MLSGGNCAAEISNPSRRASEETCSWSSSSQMLENYEFLFEWMVMRNSSYPVPVPISAIDLRFEIGINGCMRCPLLTFNARLCWKFSLLVSVEYGIIVESNTLKIRSHHVCQIHISPF